jgi:hypothetical protein
MSASASASSSVSASALGIGTGIQEQPKIDPEVEPDPLRPLKLLSLGTKSFLYYHPGKSHDKS